MKQRTLNRECTFEGKGLHTGKYAHMTICPAAPDTGVIFVRTDLGPDATVEALVSNVSSTARSTTVSKGKVKVRTIEHVLSALTGMGVDNVLIRIDSPEVPILDGSARPFAEAILACGLQEQDAERKWVEIEKEIEFRDRRSGSWIRVTPAEEPSYEVTIDFNSRVLGVQKASFDSSVDYASEIAPCRTFCFFHEISRLAFWGLVKGGDVENAIVIVEKPVSECRLDRMARAFGQPRLSVTPEGYLSNLTLRFPDECGRHKLMDLIGDFRLCGGFLKAHITAYKPGHRINTETTKLIRI